MFGGKPSTKCSRRNNLRRILAVGHRQDTLPHQHLDRKKQAIRRQEPRTYPLTLHLLFLLNSDCLAGARNLVHNRGSPSSISLKQDLQNVPSPMGYLRERASRRALEVCELLGEG